MSSAVIKTYPVYDRDIIFLNHIEGCPKCQHDTYKYQVVTEYLGGTPSSIFDAYWIAENRICEKCGCRWYIQYRSDNAIPWYNTKINEVRIKQ